MIVVNLCGSPGAGKSTGAAYIFSQLKMDGINCELVTEFAKDLTWDQNLRTLDDQLYVLANQYHRLFRLKDKVDVVVTDSPLYLSLVYNNQKQILDDSFNRLVMNLHNQFDNMNYLLHRVKPYNSVGRNQTAEESDALMNSIKNVLDTNNIVYTESNGDICSYKYIYNEILKKVSEIKNDQV